MVSQDQTQRSLRRSEFSVLRSLRHGGHGEFALGRGPRPHHDLQFPISSFPFRFSSFEFPFSGFTNHSITESLDHISL